MTRYIHVCVDIGNGDELQQLTLIDDNQYVRLKKFAKLVSEYKKYDNFNTIDLILQNNTYLYYLHYLELSEEDRIFGTNCPYYLHEYLFDVIPKNENGTIAITHIKFLEINSIETII